VSPAVGTTPVFQLAPGEPVGRCGSGPVCLRVCKQTRSFQRAGAQAAPLTVGRRQLHPISGSQKATKISSGSCENCTDTLSRRRTNAIPKARINEFFRNVWPYQHDRGSRFSSQINATPAHIPEVVSRIVAILLVRPLRHGQFQKIIFKRRRKRRMSCRGSSSSRRAAMRPPLPS
jgi:hypothetical protein